MNRLHHNGERDISAGCEIPMVNHEQRLTRIVAAEIASALQVDYRNSDIVVKLLTSCLERCLCNGRDSLLEQYLHTQLDILADTVKDKFGLDRDGTTSVDYGYATHAKLNTILDAGLAVHKHERAHIEDEIGTLRAELSEARRLLTEAQDGLQDLKKLNGGKDE